MTERAALEETDGTLAGLVRQRIAEASLRPPVSKKVAAQSGGSLFPESGVFGSSRSPRLGSEWFDASEMPLPRMRMMEEFRRLGLDPEMIDCGSPHERSVGWAELVLWLASHSRGHLNAELHLAAEYGPSAVGSLATVLSRAAGQPAR